MIERRSVNRLVFAATKYRVKLGTDVCEASAEAAEIAFKTGQVVEFAFNGETLTARPGDSPADVLLQLKRREWA